MILWHVNTCHVVSSYSSPDLPLASNRCICHLHPSTKISRSGVLVRLVSLRDFATSLMRRIALRGCATSWKQQAALSSCGTSNLTSSALVDRLSRTWSYSVHLHTPQVMYGVQAKQNKISGVLPSVNLWHLRPFVLLSQALSPATTAEVVCEASRPGSSKVLVPSERYGCFQK